MISGRITNIGNDQAFLQAPQFIQPNSFLDEAATAQARQDAINSVEPVLLTVTQGQRIVGVGEVVDAADLEMLQQLGLLQQETDWRQVISVFTAVLLGVFIVVLYWESFHDKRYASLRYQVLFVMLVLLFVFGAKLMVPGRTSFSYLFPAAAMSMLIAVIYDVRLSMIVTIVVSTLVGFIAADSLELAVYTSIGGLLAVLTLGDEQQFNAFFRAGTLAALANMAVIVVFHLAEDSQPLLTLELMGLALTNGLIAAGLTLAGLYITGSLFGVITTLQLQELSRLDHPLLQELLRKAPGTYHHSIMVANLAEQAAEQIRANATLIRVGAFYHDVGKMNRPPFFTENQNGASPHASLDPYSSARIIISHVTDGLDLAKRYKLPDRIKDFIAEHHGDGIVGVFYAKAVEQNGSDAEPVDISRFRYPGPSPQSRETGIVMLADSVEAASSAVRPNTETGIEKLVNSIVDGYMKEGQLDQSGLTLGDIQTIRSSLIKTLKGRFHVRVKYPGNEELMAGETSEEVTPVERDGEPGNAGISPLPNSPAAEPATETA